ncbi:MAG: hypothetical protein ACO1N0_19380 [Fluviicola sp.]
MNPIETSIASYDIDGNKKEHVTLATDPLDKISKNTKISERNIDLIQKAIKKIGVVHRYEQIAAEFTDNPIILKNIETLKKLTNVVIK